MVIEHQIQKYISNQYKIFESLNRIPVVSCVNELPKKILSSKINLLNRIGSDSIQGEVYRSCIPIRLCNKELVVKIVPITRNFLKNYKNLTLELLGNEPFLTEIFFLLICKYLTKKKITCNLPLFYNFTFCKERCVLRKELLDDTTKNPLSSKYISGCGYLITEKAEGDLKKFLLNYKHSYKDILVIYHQIFSGLITLRRYTGFVHGDLHYGNVLFRKIEKLSNNEYIKYKYGKETFLIPNIGYIFFPWDFGLSFIPGSFINEDYAHHFDNMDKYTLMTQDFLRITDMLKGNKTGIKQKKFQEKARIDLKNIIKNADSDTDILISISELILKNDDNLSRKKENSIKIIDAYDLTRENILSKSTFLNKILNKLVNKL
ncbi:MAG: Haspin like kinase domain [Bacteroidota bacterium]|jgi:hypothetical protein